jgi:hypothetical protein
MDVVSKKKGFMSKKITNDKKDFFLRKVIEV